MQLCEIFIPKFLSLYGSVLLQFWNLKKKLCYFSPKLWLYKYTQGEHSPENVKFPGNSLTVIGTQHVKCYSYHAGTCVTVSGVGRNAAVHDPKPYI